MIEWLQPLQLRNEEPLEPGEWWTLVGVCIALVTFAGLASGLTLGLMSLDVVDMEVGGMGWGWGGGSGEPGGEQGTGAGFARGAGPVG